MMTYQTWKDETSRGIFSPRSRALGAVDSAFQDYEKTRGTPGLIRLSEALVAWMRSKATAGGWECSTRNAKKVLGLGTVERLVKDLLQNPTLRGKLAPFLATKTKTPAVTLEVGKKISQKDDDGKFHSIALQTKDNSCGPGCIRIVAKLVNNEDIGEDYLRVLVENAEEGASALGLGGVVKSSGTHNWGPGGHGTWLVPAALKSLRPSIRAIHSNSVSKLVSTSKKKPAIAVVAWTGNRGLHYVVVAGKMSNGKALVLDPFYGVQSVGITAGKLDNYRPIDPQTQRVADEATWHPWVCSVV
ncbi:MAG: hypothetical protein AAF517_07145 [Planctomycetota bacterium]